MTHRDGSPGPDNAHPVPPAATDLTRAVLADNPSGMTLTGTNTYVLAAPDTDTVAVVDPGPAEVADEHWRAVEKAAQGRRIELILITHHHHDHTGAVPVFHERSGAPVRAFRQDGCRQAGPITDGERLRVGGVDVRVLHTPGHTSDSVCFQLPDDGRAGSVLTGDTILGRGTTMLDHPDGTLADYLRSLDLLASLGHARVLPAHGPALESVAHIARAYREHRQERLEQVRSLLGARPEQDRDRVTVEELADQVYPGLEGAVRRVSVQTLAAHLAYLRGAGGTESTARLRA